MTESRHIASAAYLVALGLTLAGMTAVVGAQEPDTLPAATPVLPAPVAREAAARYNAPKALRATAATTIDSGQTVDGDVGALEAPLTIAGTVRGDVVAINTTVTLRAGARVEGGIFVVGGSVSGLEGATVAGEVRTYQAPLAYTPNGAEAITVEEPSGGETLLSWMRLRPRTEHDNGFRFRNFATYNRVEGLPIYGGPYITRRVPGGTVTAELFGVIRSAERFRWSSENVGHRATLEGRTNGPVQMLAGGRLEDVVESTQPWQMSNSETALATFFLHRDYRDWYSRLGGTVFAGVAGARGASLIASLSDERWASRRERDPWTLFRDAQPWRANPTVDDGRYHVFRLTGTLDTRNNPDDPWDGWTVYAQLERGHGEVDQLGARSRTAPAVGVRVESAHPSYTRGLLDLRRYTRLSPQTQLNARLVAGGWVAGDPLPLQRQLSVGGFGTMPGYDFNDGTPGRDKLRCTGPIVQPGRPAECDRIAVAQLEYRVDLGLEGLRRVVPALYGRGALVAFVDAGRGWRVRDDGTDAVDFGTRTLPALRTFLTDVGAGVDFSVFGVYVAKAVSVSSEPPNVFIRIRHRF
jgi:cytoskeletal protein CcmA (bactofilin family)